jgi:hypothetical protein
MGIIRKRLAAGGAPVTVKRRAVEPVSYIKILAVVLNICIVHCQDCRNVSGILANAASADMQKIVFVVTGI